MKTITLTNAEAKLLIEVLKLAEDSFGNHNCNDFELVKSVPDLEDRRKLMKSYHDYNGDPETFEEDEEYGDQYTYFRDYALMGYLADRVKEQIAE